MKKIGILTFHHSINEGAILQAHSLQKKIGRIVKDKKIKVEIIDYVHKGSFIRDFKEIFSVKKISLIFKKIKKFFILYNFVKKKLNLSNERIITDDYKKVKEYIKKQNYDLVCVGSDEIWKIIGGGYIKKFPNAYWLPFKSEYKKVSYAASANKTDYINLSEIQKEKMKNFLKDFDFLSVRDDYTQKILNFLNLDKKVFRVLDPTFLFNFNEINKKNINNISKKIKNINYKKIAVFNIKSSFITKFLSQYLKKKGWLIVSVTNFNPEADINLLDKLNPFEWSTVYSLANFSLTDRFHGTIFSIKNKTPFLCVENIATYKRMGDSKLKSLLNELELKNNIIGINEEPTEYFLTQKIEHVLEKTNFDSAYKILKIKKKESEEYIKNFLS